MSNENFVVVIRVPNLNQEDKNITCLKDWSVEQLKQEIQTSLPGNPKKEKQRLIHGGKELLNSENVYEVVKGSNNFIHLVCAGAQQEKSHPKSPSKQSQKTTSTTEVTTPPTSESTLRHRQPQQNVYPNMYSMYQTPSVNPQNMDVYQQYMFQYQQYMASYMQYYSQQMVNQSTNDIPAATTETVAAPPQIAANNAQPPNPQPDGAAQRINAQPGLMVDEEDIEGGDWLDAAFGLTRLGFLLSIVYYYSTTYKFVITLLVFIGIYLYQIGLFQVNRRPAIAEPAQNPPQIDDNNNQNSDEEGSENEEVRQTNPPPGLLSTAWCFLRTFVTSLVPQNPAVGAN